MLDAASTKLCVDVDGDVDVVVFLAFTICEDATAVLAKIMDNINSIA